jgi:drug/metabolite transporter (DMT)-like permease
VSRGPGRAQRLVADLALLAVAAAWGLTFPLGKIVLAALPPFAYLAGRFLLAALVMTPWLRRRHRTAPAHARWLAVATGGVFFAGYALQTIGLETTTAAKAGFITGLSVALVPVISALWTRRLPARGVLAGVGAATAGLALLTLNQGVRVEAGDLWVLGCALAFALHIVLVGRLAGTLPPGVFTAAQVVPVAVLSVLAAAADGPVAATVGAITRTGPVVWGLVAFMAATATVAALIVQTWAQRFTSAAHTALMFTFEPVAAAITAYVVLGEVMTGRQVVGAGLILAGIVTAELNQEHGQPGMEAT